MRRHQVWQEVTAFFGILASAGGILANTFKWLPKEFATVVSSIGLICFLGGTIAAIRSIKESIAHIDGFVSALGISLRQFTDKTEAMAHMATMVTNSKHEIHQVAPWMQVKRPKKERDALEEAITKACKRKVWYGYIGNFNDTFRKERLDNLRSKKVTVSIFEPHHIELPATLESTALSLLIVDKSEAVFVLSRSGARKAFFATSNPAFVEALLEYFNKIWENTSPVIE